MFPKVLAIGNLELTGAADVASALDTVAAEDQPMSIPANGWVILADR